MIGRIWGVDMEDEEKSLKDLIGNVSKQVFGKTRAKQIIMGIVLATVILMFVFVKDPDGHNHENEPTQVASLELSSQENSNSSRHSDSESDVQEVSNEISKKTTEVNSKQEPSSIVTEKTTEDSATSTSSTAISTSSVQDSTTPSTEPTTPAPTEAPRPVIERPSYDEPSQVQLPVIKITSSVDVTSKDYYVDCSINITDTTDTNNNLTDVTAVIRVRGNSSAKNTSTPPYKIKFTEKQNLLGLHEGEKFKTWVLLKTPSNLCMDYMVMKMGRAVYPENYYVSDVRICKVELNGRDMGTYIAAEQTQIKKNRVDVTEATDINQPANTFGYLLELDNYYTSAGQPYIEMKDIEYDITDFTGLTKRYKNKHYTIKNDLISADHVAFISQYMNNVYYILNRATYYGEAYFFDENYAIYMDSTRTTEEAIRAIIDIDSAVSIYLLEELTNNMDKGSGSFFIAIDFSDGAAHPKVTFMPPWDMGRCNETVPYDYYAGTIIRQKIDPNESVNPWLIQFMYNEWFREEVSKRVTELRATDALSDVFLSADIYIDTMKNEVPSSEIQEGHNRIHFYRTRYHWILDTF